MLDLESDIWSNQGLGRYILHHLYFFKKCNCRTIFVTFGKEFTALCLTKFGPNPIAILPLIPIFQPSHLAAAAGQLCTSHKNTISHSSPTMKAFIGLLTWSISSCSLSVSLCTGDTELLTTHSSVVLSAPPNV